MQEPAQSCHYILADISLNDYIRVSGALRDAQAMRVYSCRFLKQSALPNTHSLARGVLYNIYGASHSRDQDAAVQKPRTSRDGFGWRSNGA